MKGHWWSCLLGLLCMPSEVVLHEWTASQSPSSVSYVSVNASTEITCSTNLSNPLGLVLRRLFHRNTTVVYLALNKGLITRNTTADDFRGRIQVIPAKQIKEGHGFTLQLSLLGLKDTNLYSCSWTYFTLEGDEPLSSNGTVVIIREGGHQAQCEDYILDLTLIALSITAFVVLFFLFIAALIQRRKRFNKKFRPTRPLPDPLRPNRPNRVHPQNRHLHSPYSVRPASAAYID